MTVLLKYEDGVPLYLTSFCNFAHRLSDGEPIEHECYVLPPAALRAEMDGDYEEAQDLISKQIKRLR